MPRPALTKTAAGRTRQRRSQSQFEGGVRIGAKGEKAMLKPGRATTRRASADNGRQVLQQTEDGQLGLLENVQALVEKERRLMELQLLDKEKELEALRSTIQSKGIKLSSLEGSPDETSSKKVPCEGEGSSSESEPESEPEVVSRKPMVKVTTDLGDPATFANLRVLNLAGQGINETSLKKLGAALVHTPMVKELDLSGNDLSQGAAVLLAAILTHRNIALQKLNISNNKFRLEAACTLCRAIPRSEALEAVDLSSNPFYNEPGAGETLGALLGSAVGKLRSVRITIGEAHRDRSSHTRRGNAAMFAAAILGGRGSIASLGMVHCSLPKAAVALLTTEGVGKGRLKELDLSMAFLGSAGVAKLCRALVAANKDPSASHMYCLESLGLKMNAIGALGCLWVARAISSSRTLRKVCLASNDLDDSCAKQLAKAVEETIAPLEVLDISRNRFYDSSRLVETGIQALCSALETKRTVTSLGPVEHIQVSIRAKRSILCVLQENRSYTTKQDYIIRPGQGNISGTDSWRQQSQLAELYSAKERCTLEEIARAQPHLESDRVQVLQVFLPITLAQLSGPAGETAGAEIWVKWQCNPGLSWRLVRERRGQLFPEQYLDEVVAAGGPSKCASRVIDGAASRQDKLKSWQQYVVSSTAWLPGDRLVLELDASSHALEGCHIQELTIHVLPEPNRNETGQSTAARAERNPQAQAELSRKILHERAWHTTILIESDDEASANLFTEVHQIYVHTGSRSDKIVLEWDVRLETLDGRGIQDETKHHHTVAGAEWQLTKSGTTSQVLSGGSGECRISNRSDDFSFARYSVDVASLDLCVGDILTLSMRPPTHVLQTISRSKRRYRKLFKLHSRNLHLAEIQERPQPASVANAHCILNLAGATPFTIVQSPYTWA